MQFDQAILEALDRVQVLLHHLVVFVHVITSILFLFSADNHRAISIANPSMIVKATQLILRQ